MPDTTDWRTYVPLGVGDRWQYRATDVDVNDRYYGWSVDRDTTIAGVTYVVIEYCTSFRCEDGGRAGPVRYEEPSAYVAHRIDPPGGSIDEWWNEAPCSLDAPFEAITECVGRAEGERVYARGGPGYTVVIGADTLRDQSYKRFDSLPYVTEVVSGLGVISRQYPVNRPGAYDYLVYARVGGVEVGEEAFAFPTPAEDGPEPRATSTLSVWPNPARGQAAVTLAGVSAAQIEVTDLTGRRVLVLDAGPSAGSRSIPLDLSPLAPGVYAVTAVSGGRRVGTRLVSIVR